MSLGALISVSLVSFTEGGGAMKSSGGMQRSTAESMSLAPLTALLRMATMSAAQKRPAPLILDGQLLTLEMISWPISLKSLMPARICWAHPLSTLPQLKVAADTSFPTAPMLVSRPMI
ncbi:unnamed protein product [Prorocentrum cordatum]|uniref:Secreted protein n=1 Tax=Prorocentrum cordatum TaxID=2364126 RepID=A0ABN9VLQ2_9DINO|nr:unnamed protein product [Polarella glacialis]